MNEQDQKNDFDFLMSLGSVTRERRAPAPGQEIKVAGDSGSLVISKRELARTGRQGLVPEESGPMLPTTRETTAAIPLDVKDPEGFSGVLARTDRLLGRAYLEGLEQRWPVTGREVDWENYFLAGRRQIALFRLQHLVFRPDEDPRERLKPFYMSAHGLYGHPSVFFVIDSVYDRTTRQTVIELYMGIRTNAQDTEAVAEQFRNLAIGYFPGTDFSAELQGEETTALQKRILRRGVCDIAMVSALPSAKLDSKNDSLRQGLESLVDVMLGHSYTAVLIAQSVSAEVVAKRRRVLENLYTELSPAQKISNSMQTSDSRSIGLSYSDSVGNSETDSYSSTETSGTSHSTTHSEGGGSSHTSSTSDSGFFGSTSSTSSTTSSSYQDSVTYGVSHSTSTTQGKSYGVSTTVTKGRNDTVTQGVTQGVTLETVNKNVAELLQRLESSLERIKSAEGFGLWECAAYFIADNATEAVLAANAYKALIGGDESNEEPAYLTLWDSASGARSYDGSKTPRQAALLASILNGKHPTFRGGRQGSPYWEMTPGALVSGRDLPWFLTLPMASVPGVVVDEMAAFERSVLTTDVVRRDTRRMIRLGDVYHMGQRDGVRGSDGEMTGRAVELDLDAFTGHCLITGATGSGKSNTVGVLLDRFVRANVPFLVIEPAKGEYRNDFRWVQNPDGSPIAVFTTHPCVGRLLRINPFRFPSTIHVLEHIDRLLSVFSSCWELIEAQPALLKKGVERAYVKAGWNLIQSRCQSEKPKFPTFATLISALRTVIKESDYDDRAKSVYTGALVTRVESLAGGLLGEVFQGTRDVSYETLFSSNCVVDLSRLGSADTKSLIMGILVTALSEWHTDEALRKGIRNSSLRHVTVLEEAHNLLRNTETMAGGGSTTVTKAIETMGNAIAEMRTYGEGFLIVDQSPGALDICATRNTNTKVIMRLPEQRDNEAMAKALALDEWQGKKIAKLNPGVAIVFQNTWRAPVLTLVDKAPDHRYEKAATPESVSMPEAYWMLQREIATRIAAWAPLTGSAEATARADILTWLTESARREICEKLSPGAWEYQETAIAALEARRERHAATERSRIARFLSQDEDLREALPEVVPLPLSAEAIAEAKDGLEGFFASLNDRNWFPAIGRLLVNLLGLQNLWRDWMDKGAYLLASWKSLRNDEKKSALEAEDEAKKAKFAKKRAAIDEGFWELPKPSLNAVGLLAKVPRQERLAALRAVYGGLLKYYAFTNGCSGASANEREILQWLADCFNRQGKPKGKELKKGN